MLSRRALFTGGLAAAAGLYAGAAAAQTVTGFAEVGADPIGDLLAAQPAFQPQAQPRGYWPSGREVRHVSVLNLHTDERFSGVYFERGAYLPDAMAELNHVLRDYRNGQVHPIDPRLLDALDDLSATTGARDGFKVISAYRSPATNAAMREKSEGVAKHSLHMDGMAIDIRSDAIDLSQLHRAAIALGRGGVGYYPRSEFVHVDVGPVRTWQGV